jgi:hypothetical protein
MITVVDEKGIRLRFTLDFDCKDSEIIFSYFKDLKNEARLMFSGEGTYYIYLPITVKQLEDDIMKLKNAINVKQNEGE